MLFNFLGYRIGLDAGFERDGAELRGISDLQDLPAPSWTSASANYRHEGMFGLYANIWDRAHELTPPWTPATCTQLYLLAQCGVYDLTAGSNEIQRNIIATRGLGLPRS